jgi:hypothetical protein
VVEANDEGLYVLKFRGAGQGPKVLVAELLGGELARAAGLPVPEIVLMELDGALARTEPDPEIQALIRASSGLNLALDFLPGAVMFDPVVERPEPILASSIVWLDAYLSNVDRTPRNANLLMWHGRLWLIDQGSALYFQHAWSGEMSRSQDPFPRIRDHILLPFAGALEEADRIMSERITSERIVSIVAELPGTWLDVVPASRYAEYLIKRLEAPRRFLEEAMRARASCV